MFIHRKNALKAHQHISYCSIQRDHFKKTISMQNLIKIFKIFPQGNMPRHSMCAADIIISIWKEPFFHLECNQNIKIMTCFPKKLPGAIYN